MRISLLFIETCRRVNLNRVSRRLIHEKLWNESIAASSEQGVKNQLTELSIPFTQGYTCLHVQECMCSKNSPGEEGNCDLFVNKRTGYFLCKQCKRTGDWSAFTHFLRKAKEDVTDLSKFKQEWEWYDKGVTGWPDLVLATEPLNKLDQNSVKNTLKGFNLPETPKTALGKLKVRIKKDKSLLIFPLSCSSSVVGYKTIDSNGIEMTNPKSDCPGFLQYSINSDSTAAVVVTKITDLLALIGQNLYDYDIICLQYGTKHLPQATLPFLEKYDKLILWLREGNVDSTGNIARKLGEKRCYIIKPIENQVSVSAAVAGNENIKEIISNAKIAWHEFVTTFTTFREDIFVDMLDVNQTMGIPWKRFPQLTNILKGHRRGELTVVTGPTGIGKTTFLSEYSLDLAMQGVNTLWGSFEIKNTRLGKIMLQQFAENPVPTDLRAYNELCDKFEELPLYFLNFHGQQDLERVMDAVVHCSYTYDIAHVIIDNVQFMIEVAPDLIQLDRFWKQDYMIQAFRSFASKYNCHVTLVMHPKKVEGMELTMNSIFGGVKASQEADNVLIMQHKSLNTFSTRKYLQVCKNRHTGDLGIFPLSFDKKSLCFSKPQLSSQPPQELDYKNSHQNEEESDPWEKMEDQQLSESY